MSIPEAVSLVVKAAEIGEPGEIMIMNMGELKNVLELAKEILGKLGKSDYPIKNIGIRPGETLDEELMTQDEAMIAVRKDNFFVIKP